MIGIAVVLVLVVGPLALALTGLIRAIRTPLDVAPDHVVSRDWRLPVSSALLYALAFNLTFFLQELFLVVPKALTPGLRPTLFHNNHAWQGEHPLASLFQGTGALAVLVSGVVCALLMRLSSGRSSTVRLFLIWMTYHGFFLALPQVVMGAISARSDVGMAMTYLRLGATAKTGAALVALATIPPVAIWLTRALLAVAEDPVKIATYRARNGFVFYAATLPALIGTLLIIPFRVPREFIEVVIVPTVVTVIGIGWIQAGAWRVVGVRAGRGLGASSIIYPLAAILILLVVFQLLLRPGIPFF